MLLVVVAVVATSQATDGRLWKKRNQKSGVDAWREHNRTALGSQFGNKNETKLYTAVAGA